MISSRKYKRCGLGAALFIAYIFFFSLMSLHYVSAGHDHQQKEKEPVRGSEPPKCVNKCLNCKPCLPYLFDIHDHGAHHDDDDYSETYYPVRWVCRCSDKVFEP
ncbi:PREDICTED: EPIDERMAL PATTERNING FACTOR-like protein 8 [Camelina sativa]|uniref:Epidermal patterning factor-like protein n=1 Tax=Camelina sativa TaxID=90675 RepID=A0ABM0TR53_CAMSA|nr:PREDICTED: EPIDERMAL PATTERNING FACTOR-like protein 8 [Camelina sativa]